MIKSLPRLIGCTGKQCAGKDEFFKIWKSIISKHINEIFIHNFKFTDPLLEMQHQIYEIAGLASEEPERDRKLLQFLGTDWGRAKDPDIWVKTLKQRIDNCRTPNGDIAGYIVVTNVRFDNEADMIKKMDGTIVKIVASDELQKRRSELMAVDFIENHVSEAGIDNSKVDHVIVNDLDLVEFARNIRTTFGIEGG